MSFNGEDCFQLHRQAIQAAGAIRQQTGRIDRGLGAWLKGAPQTLLTWRIDHGKSMLADRLWSTGAISSKAHRIAYQAGVTGTTRSGLNDRSNTHAGSKPERLGSVGEYDQALRAMDAPIRPDTLSSAV